MLIFDTICALATPPYRSALALLRLSGPHALEVFSHLIKKDIQKLESNHAYLLKMYENENEDSLIDEGVVTIYRAPKSYTGFDLVEMSIHGSPLIVEMLLSTLVKYGARRAEKGEFSAQAYYNKKIDLLKAEGINDLINARSIRGVKIANHTLKGKNSEEISSLHDSLLSYVASLEYYVEDQFSDDEEYLEEFKKIKKALVEDLNKWSKITEDTKKANQQYQGINVAIIGEPNVGKSTLLNAILNEDKAIVSPIPGTTRDTIEGDKEIKGISFHFSDTAGIRKTEDIIENLGIDRSYKMIEKADLVLYLADNDFSNEKELEDKLKNKITIKVGTKKDLGNKGINADILLSSYDDLSPLFDLIFSKLDLDAKIDPLFLGQREEDYLNKIIMMIKDTIEKIDTTKEIDIVSDSLINICHVLDTMLGNDESKTLEDVYNTLFSHFCLGK